MRGARREALCFPLQGETSPDSEAEASEEACCRRERGFSAGARLSEGAFSSGSSVSCCSPCYSSLHPRLEHKSWSLQAISRRCRWERIPRRGWLDWGSARRKTTAHGKKCARGLSDGGPPCAKRFSLPE